MYIYANSSPCTGSAYYLSKKIGFLASKLQPLVKITVKTAESGVFGLLYTERRDL